MITVLRKGGYHVAFSTRFDWTPFQKYIVLSLYLVKVAMVMIDVVEAGFEAFLDQKKLHVACVSNLSCYDCRSSNYREERVKLCTTPSQN